VSNLKLMILFFIAFSNSARAIGVKSNEIKIVTKFVAAFTQAAEKNDFSKIAKILGTTNNESLKYALGNSKMLPYQKESMLSIASRAKSIVITPIFYENKEYRKFGNGYTVFFIVTDEVSEVLLGKKKWLVDYVACDFFIKDSKISYGINVCYSETEGPFAIQYNSNL
jgi:hypothetical protein